jgi:Domain of unknown function (DUF4410)
MNIPNSLRSSFVAALALSLCSCASVSVRNVNTVSAKPTKAPKHFYVVPFSVANTNSSENLTRKKMGRLKNEVQQLVAGYLVSELSKNIAPATLVNSPSAAHGEGWLVTGELTRVSEGSWILRMGIGLGAGGTKVETNVAVQNLPASNAPFLRFSTSGGSNAMPGAATNPIPFSSLPSALLQSTLGVTDDSARTARMITANIADYMVQRGWLAAGTVQKPKMAKP